MVRGRRGRCQGQYRCRCFETAHLTFGRVEPWEPLGEIFEDRARREPERTGAVRRAAVARPAVNNLVMVTHGANILGLTGIRSPRPASSSCSHPWPAGRFA